jgi:hypothetical protein
MRRLLHSSIAMHDLVDQVKDDSGEERAYDF